MLGRAKNVIRNRLTQPKAGGGEKDSGFHGARCPFHLDNSDKVLRPPNENQVDAPLARLALRAQLRKSAGGIELFQAFADFRGIERAANFLGDNARKVRHAQVRVTIEADIQHRFSPGADSGSRDLGSCEVGEKKTDDKAEDCALGCCRPQATPGVSEQSGKVG